MIDITTLGLAVDHHSVRQARDELGRFTGAANKAEDAGTKMEQSWSKVKGVLAGLALGATIVQLVKQADTLTLLDARLKLATGSATDFAIAQGTIYRISQKSNAGLAETTVLFTKLHEPVKRLGGGVKETGKIVEAFAASLRVGGANTQEAAAATLQFAQAMGSGKLQGDEFRSIAEASPRFMKALADGMNVPIEKLKKMGSEGELTADIVGNALIKSLGTLRAEMATLPDTVGGAMTRMTNDFKVALNDINKSAGTTLGLAGMVEEARKLIPALKQEALGAFQSIGQWIDRNKETMAEVWENAKALTSEVWEVVKAATALAGAILEVTGQSGAVVTAWQVARLTVAGFKDGLEIIGAVLANIGSLILQFLVEPMLRGGKIAAVIAGVFDKDLGAKISANVKAIEDFATAGEKYADGVVNKFASGESAVATLGAAMAKSARDGEQLRAALANGSVSAADAAREQDRFARQADIAGGKTITLKNAHAELTKEQKEALQRYTDLTQGIREHITELDLEAAGGEKLNDAQQMQIKFKEELKDKYKGFTAVQREAVVKLLEEWDSKIKLAEATKKLTDALQDAAKAWEQQYVATEQSNERLREQIADMAYANATIRTGIDYTAKLTTARLREKATLAELAAIKAEDKNLDFVRGQQLRDEAQLLRTLADLNEKNAAALQLKKIDDYLDPNKAQSFGDALTKAFDGAGNSLAKLSNTLTGYVQKQNELNKARKELASLSSNDISDEERLKRQNQLLQKQGELGIETYASIAGAAKGFFNEGSRGYKALETAETAFRAYQLASDLVRGASAAAVAIAQQATGGDVYTAIPRMAAMAAIMASLGFATGFLGSSGAGPIDVKKRQEQTGTGTVLGDLSAKSESITKSIEHMEDAATLANTYQSGMLASLKNIEAAMTGVAQQILRANGLTTGKNFGIQEGVLSTNKGDPILKAIGLSSLDKTFTSLPIIGGVLQTLQSLWGKTSQKIADTGIEVQGNIGNVGVSQYADVQTTKSSWFGLKKSTSNSRVTQGVSEDIARQFDLIFSTLGETLVASAAQLNKDGEQTKAALENFVVSITNLSLKDMDGQKIQEAIGAAIGAQADRMAQAIVPGLEDFQKVGEGYYETLVRVAGATETAQNGLEKFGIAAVDYTKIANKQGDVAAEIVKQSITQYETVGDTLSSVGKLVSTFTGEASEILDVYGALREVRSAMTDVKLSGEALTATLVLSSGGLDNLKQNLATYYDEFYTKEEQTAIGLGHLKDTFEALGYSLPKSREEFRALVEGIDTTTDSGQTLLGKVLGLSKQFADLVPTTQELADAAEEAAQKVEDLAEKMRKELAKAFDDLVRTLKDAVGDAFDTFKNAISAQKDKLKAAYDAQVSVIDDAVKAARAQYDSTMARIDEERKAARAKYDAEMLLIDIQKKVIEEAQKAQQSAYKDAVKAVAAEKETAVDAYRKASAALTTSIKAAGDTVSKLKSVNDLLRNTLESMNPSGADGDLRKSAQIQLTAMLQAAQSAGIVPDQKQLQTVLQTLAKPSEDLFGSFEDYLRDFYYTKNDISKLANATGAQLDEAQSQLDALNAMKDAADIAHQANLDRLDGIKEALDLNNDLAKEAFDAQLEALSVRSDAAKSTLESTNTSLDTQAESAQKILDGLLETLDKAKSDLGDKLKLDLKQLDDLLSTAQAQYEQLVGINAGVKDIPTALQALATAMQAYANATGKPAPVVTGTTQTPMNQWVTAGAVQTYTDSAGAVAIQAVGNTDPNQTIIHAANGTNYTVQQAADFINQNLTTNIGAITSSATTTGVSLSSADAIAGLNTGTIAALTDTTGSSKINGYTIDQIRTFIKDRLEANKLMDIYNAAKTYGYTLATLDAIMGYPAGTAAAWAKANDLPTFASGGMHSGGLRLVGEYGPEVEATGASRIWRLDQLVQGLRGTNDKGENDDELAQIRRELSAMRQELKATTEAIAINTNRGAKKLEGWDTDGIPETRVLT